MTGDHSKRYQSLTVVAKLGGDALSLPERLDPIAKDMATLHQKGVNLVVMHGGGPQASELCKRLGIERRIVGGRRITDAPTLEVMKMVLGGQVSINLTLSLTSLGLPAIGLCGVSAGIIDAVKRPPRVMSGCGDEPIDFGHVGDIVKVNTKPVQLLCEAGYVPVLNSLGSDEQGRAYNINADIAATRVAHAMKADHLVLITGKVPGVLRDPNDLATRIARLTASEARQAIVDGIIKGGMIPKIEESLEVLERGVGAIHIVGTLERGDLPNVLLDPGCIGTVLVPDEG